MYHLIQTIAANESAAGAVVSVVPTTIIATIYMFIFFPFI
jgi:hypothetical protein